MVEMIVKSTEKKFENGVFKITKVIEETNITESDLLKKKSDLQFRIADLKNQRQNIDKNISDLQSQIVEADEMILVFSQQTDGVEEQTNS